MTQYLGTFRLPYTPGSPDHFSDGGIIACRQVDGQLFVATRSGVGLGLSPVAPVNGPLETLPIATAAGGFIPIDLRRPSGHGFSGFVLIDRLVSAASIFYDANGTQRVGHFFDNQWRTILDPLKQGFVAGYLCPVPGMWQQQLGDFLTGQCCLPIITRTSAGPAAFGVKLADFDQPGVVPAKPLVYYPHDHQTLGNYDTATGPLFNQTMQVAGCHIYGDELIFAGTIGIGSDLCYGVGTTDPTRHNQTIDGVHYCYDPEKSAKGGHAYPYQYQLWKYSIPELLSAQNPWDVIPTIERLPNLLPGVTRLIGCAGHGDTLYLSQYQAERNARVGNYPVVHVFKLETPEPPPPPEPQPPTVEEQLAEATRKLDAIRAVLN